MRPQDRGTDFKTLSVSGRKMPNRIVCTRCGVISRGFVGNCLHVENAIADERSAKEYAHKMRLEAAGEAQDNLNRALRAESQIRDILDEIKRSHETEQKCSCVGGCLLERYGHGRSS